MNFCQETYNINSKVYLIRIHNYDNTELKKLFVGKNIDCKSELIAMKNNGEFDASIKESYSYDDWNFIKEHYKTSEMIFESIYPDDTFDLFRKKISMYLKAKDNFCIWINKEVDNNDRLQIINDMFGQCHKLSKNKIIDSCLNLFNKNFASYIDKDELDKISLNKILKAQKNLKMALQVGFTYNGNYKETMYIKPNPLKSYKLDENFIDKNTGSKKIKYSLMSYKNKLFETVTYYQKTINLCFKAEIEKKVKDKELPNKDKIIKAIEYKYFPLESIDLSKEIIDIISSVSERIETTQCNAINNEVNVYVQHLMINLKPTYFTNTINLDTIFKNIATSNMNPFIIYKSKSNNSYKITKYALSTIYNNTQDMAYIDSDDLNKWTYNALKNKLVVHAKESLEFKYFFKQFNNYYKFITIILHDDGHFNIIYNFKILEFATIDEIIESFKNINVFISNIVNDTSILYPILDINIFKNTFSSLIEIKDFNLNLELNQSITYNFDYMQKIIAYMYPYFDEIENKSEKNIIKFKYRRINSYYTEVDIFNFIKKNINKGEDLLFKKLIQKFSLENELAAQQVYESYQASSDNMDIFLNKYTIGTVVRYNFRNNRLSFKNLPSLHIYCRMRNLVNSFFKLKEIKENRIEQKENIKLDLIDNPNENIKADDILDLPESDIGDDFAYGIEEDEENPYSKYIYEEEEEDLQNDDEFINAANVNVQMNEEKNPNIDTEPTGTATSPVLKKLQAADRELFSFKSDKKNCYSSQCQYNNFRQPVVLNKSQLKYINENYPNSYRGFVQAASSPSKIKENYYICPSIWCPQSQISMTDKQLEENDGKCPIEGETFIDFRKANYWLDPKTKQHLNRYPGFLKKHKHPKDIDDAKDSALYRLPCCFKSIQSVLQGYDKEKNTNKIELLEEIDQINQNTSSIKKNSDDIDLKPTSNRYIYTSSTDMTLSNRYSILPPIISLVLQDEKQNVGGYIKNSTNCFVRKGTEEHNQMFLSSIVMLLNDEQISNVAELINCIENNISPLDYIRLNNGSTLKKYYNPYINIYDKEEYSKFKAWMNDNKNNVYIEKFELHSLLEYINSLKVFTLDVNDEKLVTKKKILREYIIFNSLRNFINYIKSDISKTHEELIDLFSNKFHFSTTKSSLNKYNIILIEENPNNSSIFCSKFYDAKFETDLLKPFVFILKQNQIYEPIVCILKGEEVLEFYQYDKLFQSNIKKIVFLYRNNCNIKNLKSYVNPGQLELVIKSTAHEHNYKIKYVVITSSYKSIGFLLHNNIFIPFNRYNTVFTTVYKFIYIYDIYKLSVKVDFQNIKKLFDRYNHLLAPHKNGNNDKNFAIYNISDQIWSKDDSSLLAAIILNVRNFKKILLPIQIDQAANNLSYIKELLIDEDIFVNYHEVNPEKEFNQDYVNKQNILKKSLLEISKCIISNPEYYKELNYVTHKLNPFSSSRKIEFILDLINTIIASNNYTNIEDDVKKLIAIELLYKNALYIIKSSLSEMKLRIDEIYLDQHDIFNDKLDIIFKTIQNPYKYYQYTIEDITHNIPIQINNKLKGWDSILNCESFNEIPIKEPWGKIMGNKFEMCIPKKYDNNYILNIFRKIANYKSSKKLTFQILNQFIDIEYKKDYMLDSDAFIKTQKDTNPSFKKLYDKKYSNDFAFIEPIFQNVNYYYSLNELRKLSEFIKINLIVIARSPNAMYLDNGSEFYIVFFGLINKDNRNTFNLVIKNKEKIIYRKSDFNEKFLSLIHKIKV